MANFMPPKFGLNPCQFKTEKTASAKAMPLAGVGQSRRRPFFTLHASLRQPNMLEMFDTITAELATAADKLAHLRRFL
jgi:hypothetical protein